MVAQIYNPCAYKVEAEESKIKASLGWLERHCLKKTKTKPKSHREMVQWPLEPAVEAENQLLTVAL